MKRIKSAIVQLLKLSILVLVVIGVLYKMRVNIPGVNAPKLYAHLDSMGLRVRHEYEAYFPKHEAAEAGQEHHKVVVTSPLVRDVVIAYTYVCQIHSKRHIDVCALEDGYLETIPIREGQSVKAGDLLFKTVPTLYKARLDAELAERNLARMELNFTKTLAERKGVSQNDVLLHEAKLAKAQAKVDLAQAELDFATVKAPFDGIVDRLHTQKGSLVKEGDMLTTLSDNSVMWVYFNVTERRYLEYMAERRLNEGGLDVELVLADQSMFPHLGKIDLAKNIGAIEANFNNETGNISFRADFPNPDRLLRHGQTGTVLIRKTLKGAIVIPQRSTFENLAKRYVYVVGKDDVVHQREVVVDQEQEDIFVIGSGLDPNDKIVFEGTRQVQDGNKVEYEFHEPKLVMSNQKNKAE
jgi:membrane fusion protein, multidrug efflux system